MFSATLFFSSMVFASDLLTPPTYCIKEPGPGLYLRFEDDGALSAKLSLTGVDKVKDTKDVRKVDGADRFSFFLSPEFGTKQNDMSTNIAEGMPAIDARLASRSGTDYGIQCGFNWKFK